ncbi:MAG: nuclear transport factor 2 family protein [Dehalococcoidia bacterium]|nr:nuclear transport factor 2 family protein [Dehalococcoidia bacterium]
MQRTDPATIGIVRRYNESFNQGEVDGVMAVMTGDRVVETPIPPPDQSRFQGQEAVRALWQDFFRSTSSIAFATEDMFASGDRCLVQWLFAWVGQDGQSSRVRSVDYSK